MSRRHRARYRPSAKPNTSADPNSPLLTPDEVEGVAAAMVFGQKDIWGSTWRMFNGIDDGGGGPNEIQDNSSDWVRARMLEPYVFRAQDQRGKAISQVPLVIWEKDRNGRRVAVDHEALEILRFTNPEDSTITGTAALMRYTLLSLDTHGRCAWKLAFNSKRASNGNSMPSEVYWLAPASYTPLHGYEVREDVQFAGIKYMGDGSGQRFRPEEIVYFQTDNPADPVLGTSKTSVLRMAINLRMYSTRSNYDFFRNSMRPDWILTGEWKNTQENVERIRRAIRRHYSGESNRQPLILGDGSKAQLLTTTAKDAEWVQMMRLVEEEIAAVYGVPVLYMNNFERATYENAKTARLMLWHDTLMSETQILAEMLTRRFLWRFWPETRDQKLTFGFDYGAVEGLGDDVGLKWERVKDFRNTLINEVKERITTPNQARRALVQLIEEMGLDSTPWQNDTPDGLGDTFFQPFGNLPSEQLSVQAIIDIEAARSSNPTAGDLIENVPGAPTAADNAQRGLARQERLQESQQAQAQARQQQQQTQQNDLMAEIVEIKSLLSKPQSAAVVKAPHPIPIRDNRLAPIQKRVSGRFKAHFQDQQTSALRSLRKAKRLKTDMPDVSSMWDHEVAKRLAVEIVRSGVLESGRAAYGASAEDYSLGVSLADDSPWIDQYMGQRLHLIHGIDDTTSNNLRDSLAKGAEAGESMDQLSDRVSAIFADAIDNRADTIARTETIQAYGAASVQSYRDAGIDRVQIYDGSDDPECAAVNGMIVTPDEADQLMGDEHPNGTRGVAPVIDSGFQDIQAATFVFNSVGVAIA